MYEVSKRVLQEEKDSTLRPAKADFLGYLVLWSLDIVLKKLQVLLKGLYKERPFTASQSTTDSQPPPNSYCTGFCLSFPKGKPKALSFTWLPICIWLDLFLRLSPLVSQAESCPMCTAFVCRTAGAGLLSHSVQSSVQTLLSKDKWVALCSCWFFQTYYESKCF